MKMIAPPAISFVKCALAVFAVTGITMVLSQAAELTTQRAPNVIFIATDDLNDWVGPLDSPIKAKTPNLDRLAASGVTFLNAQTSGTYCSPSRVALFTGRHPATTGVYNTQVYWRDHPDLRPLQLGFQQAGYQTYGAGKLFHHPAGFVDLRGWTGFYVRTAAQYQPVIEEMKKSAPASFAPEGLGSDQLKLIIEGESFHWEPKSGSRNQTQPKANKDIRRK